MRALESVEKIQSIGASNRIEGIFASDKRLREISEEKTAPENRSEQEIAGYREVLKVRHENYKFINLTSNFILQLHRDLYTYTPSGGCFKNSDSSIAETSNGEQVIRFVPVPAFQTSDFMNDLCQKFSEASIENKFDSLLLIPMFILDFLCIHPFSDSNGLMSRLLTLLLLYKSGHTVGKFISIEMLIEQSKDTYYEALQSSSIGWHENRNNYEPFTKYMLGILLKAYKEFENRVRYINGKKKSDRIKILIDESIAPVTKKQTMERCSDISKVTVERTLIKPIKSGDIRKIDNGKLTAYLPETHSQNQPHHLPLDFRKVNLKLFEGKNESCFRLFPLYSSYSLNSNPLNALRKSRLFFCILDNIVCKNSPSFWSVSPFKVEASALRQAEKRSA